MIEMQIPLFNLVCMESLLDRYDNPRRGEQGFNNNFFFFFFNNNKTWYHAIKINNNLEFK